jgi:hypothetical protein
MTRRVPEKLDVYEPGTRYTSPADEIISYEDGRRRVEAGAADFVNHGNAIRMRRSSAVRAGSFECRQDLVEKYGAAQ